MLKVKKEEIKKLPAKPGVYIFKDKSGKIIYIGKALSLKNRLQNYFQNRRLDSKTKTLVAQVAQINFLLTESEFEALILEAKLIKQHQPKFNVRLKDNTRYLYIAIHQDPFPYLYIVRRPELEKDLLDWYGPFPSANTTRRVFRFIRRIFPYRSCRTLPSSPCLYYHLKLCPGVCFQPVKNYPHTIRQIRRLLSGQSKTLIKNLERKMKRLAKELKFEEAQTVKKQIVALQHITQTWRASEDEPLWQGLWGIRQILVKYQKIEPTTLQKIEGYDISNLGEKIAVGSQVVFINGQAEKSLYRKFNLHQKIRHDPAGIREIISRRLKHSEWLYPQLILVDGGKTQVQAAFAALKKHHLVGQIALLGLAKRQEVIVIPKIEKERITSWKLLKLSCHSPALRLLQQVRDEAHRFAQKYYHLLHRKTIR